MADILVVSITAARYVRKGPGRPYFDDDMRMKFLAALECVDYVMLPANNQYDQGHSAHLLQKSLWLSTPAGSRF